MTNNLFWLYRMCFCLAGVYCGGVCFGVRVCLSLNDDGGDWREWNVYFRAPTIHISQLLYINSMIWLNSCSEVSDNLFNYGIGCHYDNDLMSITAHLALNSAATMLTVLRWQGRSLQMLWWAVDSHPLLSQTQPSMKLLQKQGSHFPNN